LPDGKTARTHIEFNTID